MIKNLVLGFLLVLLGASWSYSSEYECPSNCFDNTNPYVQINGYPVIKWETDLDNQPVDVCPACSCNPRCDCVSAYQYQPGDSLDLVFGLWDICDEYRGQEQKVCGEFFIVVTDEHFRYFAYLDSQMDWHIVRKISEIKPYRVIQEEGAPPFSVHYYFPKGVDLPSGTYKVIAFVDKVLDNKPTLEIGAYKYCFINLVFP